LQEKEALEKKLAQVRSKVLSDTQSGPDKKVSAFPLTVDGAAFLATLAAYRYYDSKKFDKVATLALKVIALEAEYASLPRIYVEKALFLFGLAHERLGSLPAQRAFLQQQLSLATKRHNTESRAVLINTILRSFVNQKLYSSADKFAEKVTFPEDAHANQAARYNYFLGRIRAVQGAYADAAAHLTEANRKSPQTTGRGFQLAIQKTLTIVTLLSGEMPERDAFARDTSVMRALAPYLTLVTAVARGKMSLFTDSVSENRECFARDGLLTLVTRLPLNVRKMALKLICKSYSRIALSDVAARLELDNAHDIEYILQNAITNHVIDAEISPEKILISKSEPDIYGSTAPQAALAERIAFCLRTYEKTRHAIRHLPEESNSDSDDGGPNNQEDLQSALDFDLNTVNFSDMGEDF